MTYCNCPGWLWCWRIWWNEDWQGKPKYSEKTCPSATLSITNPTWPDPGSNPGHCRGKPATNRLSYGAANFCSLFTDMNVLIIKLRNAFCCAVIIIFPQNIGTRYECILCFIYFETNIFARFIFFMLLFHYWLTLSALSTIRLIDETRSKWYWNVSCACVRAV
jgi:hypothetical protein